MSTPVPAIILENDSFVVINKPAGLLVHGNGRTDEPTVVDWIVDTYPDARGVGESLEVEGATIDRSGIVHRLDKYTSGCMVIVRNQDAYRHFKAAFKKRNVTKEYHAFVYGAVKEPGTSLAQSARGLINQPIGRSNKDIRRYSAQRGARGTLRKAKTEYDVLATFVHHDKPYSLMAFYPLSGRTHQIRVHAKYMNHPIVADPLYAGKLLPELGFARQALHARKLSFDDQLGERLEVVAPYPKDFQQALELVSGYTPKQ